MQKERVLFDTSEYQFVCEECMKKEDRIDR
jgi:hypothetical protein